MLQVRFFVFYILFPLKVISKYNINELFEIPNQLFYYFFFHIVLFLPTPQCFHLLKQGSGQAFMGNNMSSQILIMYFSNYLNMYFRPAFFGFLICLEGVEKLSTVTNLYFLTTPPFICTCC